MKKLLTLIITLSVLQAYPQVTIKLTMKGFGNRAIIVYWQDFQSHMDTVKLDKNGYTELKYPFSKPAHIRLETIEPQSSSPFLSVLPGETISINKDVTSLKVKGSLQDYNNFLIQTDSILNVEFKGKKPDYNTVTSFVLQRSDPFFQSFNHPQSAMIKDIYTLQAITNYKLYPLMVKYAGDSIKMKRIAGLLKNPVKTISLDDELLRYLDRIDLRNSSLVNSIEYQIVMMNNLIRVLRIHAGQNDPSLKETDEYVIEKRIINDLIKSGDYKIALHAYNLHHRIYDYTKYPMQLAGVNVYLDDFEKENPNYQGLPGLKKQYKLQLSTLGSLVKGANAPSFKLPDAKGEMVSLLDFKGKVVYLDFWATWCGPCLKEMPYMKTLEHKFQGKDVQFITISIDTRVESWLKKLTDLKLESIQLIESKGGTNSKIAKDYKIHGVPHYVLIDKNGKIASSYAPIPSMTDQLEKEINELLE